jgi:hypothetical protein
LLVSASSKILEEHQNMQHLEQPQHIVGNWTLHNIASDVQVLPTLFYCQIRSRDEEEEPNFVPDQQFSSLKYNMTFAVDSNAMDFTPTSFVVAKLVIIDYHTSQEIFKGPNREPVIEAPKRISLDYNKETGMLETTFKYHWESVSYHHAKKPFAFLLSFYLFLDGHERLLFDARSGPITTFARRPKVSERPPKNGSKGKSPPRIAECFYPPLKRQLSEDETFTLTPEPKKANLNNITRENTNLDDPFANIGFIAPPLPLNITPLQKFLNVLNEVKDLLSNDEKQIAFMALKTKFFNAEPTMGQGFRELINVAIVEK